MITHEAQVKGAQANIARADHRAKLTLDLIEQGYTYDQLAEYFQIRRDLVRTLVHRSRQRLGVRSPRRPLPPLSPVPGPGEYYVDPDAREAYSASQPSEVELTPARVKS